MIDTRKCARCKKPLGRTKGRYCQTCKSDNKRRAHDRRITMNGFTSADYWKLYEAQDGHCAIHRCRANGRTKFLAVEHDHKCDHGHNPKEWCRYCVRGLTCSRHNTWIAQAGDDPLVFSSLYLFLVEPPARRILNENILLWWSVPQYYA